MTARANGRPEHFCSLRGDRGAAQSSPEAVHSLTNRLPWHWGPVCLGTPQGPGHTNLYPGNIVLPAFCYHFHSCNAALMSAVPSYSYCQYSSPLCRMNQTCKNHMTNSFTRKFPLFICHLSCFVQKCFKQLVWGRLVSEIKWRVKPANKCEREKKKNAANAEPYSHTGPKITLLIIQLQARVHSQFTALPYPAQGISMCVHKYWAVRWKRGPLHSGMGVLTLNAWVTDYFLSSWTSTLHKRRALAPSLKRPN